MVRYFALMVGRREGVSSSEVIECYCARTHISPFIPASERPCLGVYGLCALRRFTASSAPRAGAHGGGFPNGGASPGERVAACSRLQSSPFFVLTVRARASAHWAGDFELGGSGLQPPHRVWHRAVSGASHRLQGGSMV